MPAISINWGPWSGSGAAARSDVALQLTSRGIDFFSPGQGFKALEEMIAEDATQKMVLSFRYDRWLETYPAVANSRFFEGIQRQPDEDHRSSTASFGGAAKIRNEILSVPSSAERISLLHLHLCNQVSKVLGAQPTALDAHKSFKDLGLDSLTSLELCNRLNAYFDIVLPKTAIWNYPTINQLAAHIGTMFEALTGDAAKTSEDQISEPRISVEQSEELEDLLDDLGNLSEEEVRRLVADSSPHARVIDG